MSKRPITFNKPEDPSFLKKIKASIGYKEGPTVDTKRQKLEEDCDSSDDEARASESDYKPQVVVLRAGDLTEEEAEREKERLLREEQERPADLTQRVVFKKPVKKSNTAEEAEVPDQKKPSDTGEQKKGSSSRAAPRKATATLSFAGQEEEEEEEE